MENQLPAVEGNINSALKAAAGPRKSFLRRVDTPIKRIALLLFPFFATIDGFLLHRDIKFLYGIGPHGWEAYDWTWTPTLSCALFFLLSISCLLFAFTRLGDWVRNG